MQTSVKADRALYTLKINIAWVKPARIRIQIEINKATEAKTEKKSRKESSQKEWDHIFKKITLWFSSIKETRAGGFQDGS
jgi:hypothetical protein